MAKKKRSGKDTAKLPAILDRDLAETDQHVEQIKELARAQCSLVEAAAYFGLTPTRIEQFLLANDRSAMAWFGGPAAGRAELRLEQFKSVKAGDSRLQVWLGKNVLGQTDKLPTSPDDEPKARRRAWDELAPWKMTRLG